MANDHDHDNDHHGAVTEAPTLMTLPVRVEAVTVGGNLMTRAFFAQISEEPLIDPATGAFAGNLLGRVNLHSRDCRAADAPEHVHVLWL